MRRASMLLLVGAWAVATAAGCASSRTEAVEPAEQPAQPVQPTQPGPVAPAAGPAPAPAGKVEFAGCREHLDAIASCFFEVVSQIQREPKEGEPIARFLGRATWQIAAGRVHEACAPLGLTDKSTRLLLGDGSEVAVSKHEESIDEMMSGATVWHLVYRFASETCEHTAEARIELWAGGPVE